MSISELKSPPPHGALLRVEGEDAQSFLQGQLSNDMRKLSSDCAALSSLNSPKGRVLATLIVFPTQAGYGLLMAPDIVEAMQRRLQMFVLRSKVQLIRSEEVVRGLVGDATPGAEWQIQHEADHLRIRAPGAAARSWLIGGETDAPADDTAFIRGAGGSLVDGATDGSSSASSKTPSARIAAAASCRVSLSPFLMRPMIPFISSPNARI